MKSTTKHTVTNNKQIQSAFGLLAHLAKPATPQGLTLAKRGYLQKRYAAKLAAVRL